MLIEHGARVGGARIARAQPDHPVRRAGARDLQRPALEIDLRRVLTVDDRRFEPQPIRPGRRLKGEPIVNQRTLTVAQRPLPHDQRPQRSTVYDLRLRHGRAATRQHTAVLVYERQLPDLIRRLDRLASSSHLLHDPPVRRADRHADRPGVDPQQSVLLGEGQAVLDSHRLDTLARLHRVARRLTGRDRRGEGEQHRLGAAVRPARDGAGLNRNRLPIRRGQAHALPVGQTAHGEWHSLCRYLGGPPFARRLRNAHGEAHAARALAAGCGRFSRFDGLGQQPLRNDRRLPDLDVLVPVAIDLDPQRRPRIQLRRLRDGPVQPMIVRGQPPLGDPLIAREHAHGRLPGVSVAQVNRDRVAPRGAVVASGETPLRPGQPQPAFPVGLDALRLEQLRSRCAPEVGDHLDPGEEDVDRERLLARPLSVLDPQRQLAPPAGLPRRRGDVGGPHAPPRRLRVAPEHILLPHRLPVQQHLRVAHLPLVVLQRRLSVLLPAENPLPAAAVRVRLVPPQHHRAGALRNVDRPRKLREAAGLARRVGVGEGHHAAPVHLHRVRALGREAPGGIVQRQAVSAPGQGDDALEVGVIALRRLPRRPGRGPGGRTTQRVVDQVLEEPRPRAVRLAVAVAEPVIARDHLHQDDPSLAVRQLHEAIVRPRIACLGLVPSLLSAGARQGQPALPEVEERPVDAAPVHVAHQLIGEPVRRREDGVLRLENLSEGVCLIAAQAHRQPRILLTGAEPEQHAAAAHEGVDRLRLRR